MPEFPTPKTLAEIRDFKLNKSNIREYLELIKCSWKHPSRCCFMLTGKRVLRLYLSTGGWSGNEIIVDMISENLFWTLYWQKSERGGHYYFKIKL